MKKLALIIVFHASAWCMQPEKIKSSEVPSLVQLCVNKLAAMPRQKKIDAHLAHCIAHELLSVATDNACNNLAEELFYHYEHLAAEQSPYESTHWDLLTHTYHCTSPRTLEEKLERHTYGIQMLITHHEHVDPAESFMRLLKTQSAAEPYELISIPQHPQAGKSQTKNLYTFISPTGGVSIVQHTSPTPISLHTTNKGLLKIEKQQNSIEQTITISHILFDSGATITKQFVRATCNPPIISVTPNSGSFVRIDRQEAMGMTQTDKISTCSLDMIVSSHTQYRSYRVLYHLLAPEHSMGKNWYIIPSKCGSYPVYVGYNHTHTRFAALFTNNTVCVWNKEGKCVFNSILPKHAGTPLVTFFDKEDRHVHCVTMNEQNIILHSICLPTPSKHEILTKLAQLINTNSGEKSRKHPHRHPGRIASIITYIQKKCVRPFLANK